MSALGFVGLDLGSQTTLVGVAKKGGIEILANEASQRETPVVVDLGDYERFIGEQGYAQVFTLLFKFLKPSLVEIQFKEYCSISFTFCGTYS